MDYNKDIKDNRIVSQMPSNGITAFGANTSKKCERLATAIYLVTNFLSDTEPMRFRLRALSLELVRDASLAKNGSQAVEANVLEALRANIIETLSLLELAFIAGLVSEMNFTILKREYTSLRNTIEVKKSSRESRTDGVLGDNFFRESESAQSPKSNLGYSRGQALGLSSPIPLPKGHSIGQTTTAMSDRNTKGQVAPKKEERVNFESADSWPGHKHPKVGTQYTPSATPRAITDIAKESRRTRILKLVKDNREVTIKDIATHFADLSEKTIQRELVSLVDSGVLKKFGERRWSRYALV